jgi:alpha-beta hydrolase superfamily lysophospholipase
MKHNEFVFEGDGGIELRGQNWLPEGQSRAVFAIVHGMGGHSGRYTNLLDPLTSAGLEIWSYDLRGHGHSAGRRGHIQHWSEYHYDLDRFLAYVREARPGLAVFLYGHSLGTLIVAEYVLRDSPSLAGVILSGIATEPVGVATPVLIAIARSLSRIWPSFTLASGLDSNALSRDPQVVQAYQQDAMVHDRATTRFATENLATIDFIKAHAADIDLPLLVVHGAADALTAADGARAFFDAAHSSDKELWILPDRYHEAHNDFGYEQYVNDLRNWVVERI